MVYRNSPETKASAAKHTPHSYTLLPACTPSCLSSSSLHPCWTDFKLSVPPAHFPSHTSSSTFVAAGHTVSEASEQEKTKTRVCLCVYTYIYARVCVCLGAGVGMSLWCLAVQGGLLVYYNHWTMTPISSPIISYKSESPSLFLSDLTPLFTHTHATSKPQKESAYDTGLTCMKGTAFDWQMCMKGQTQDVFLHMLVCIVQALEMLKIMVLCWKTHIFRKNIISIKTWEIHKGPYYCILSPIQFPVKRPCMCEAYTYDTHEGVCEVWTGAANSCRLPFDLLQSEVHGL